MKCKIQDTSYIVNFMDSESSSKSILEFVENKLNKELENKNFEMISGWFIHFSFIYNNVRGILVYKNGPSYPVEKYKEISIHIPIPSINQVPWGVFENQYIQDIGHLDKRIKNFDVINLDYAKYSNCNDYIIDAMLESISHAFKNGFTISGTKVRLTLW
jgi:hypothetical protein